MKSFLLTKLKIKSYGDTGGSAKLELQKTVHLFKNNSLKHRIGSGRSYFTLYFSDSLYIFELTK